MEYILKILLLLSEEREKPELLSESPARRKRIAKESGKTEQQVRHLISWFYTFVSYSNSKFETNEKQHLTYGFVWQVSQLVAQLFQMRVRMKNLMGVMQGGSVPALSNLEEAMKSEQKVKKSITAPKLVSFSIISSLSTYN